MKTQFYDKIKAQLIRHEGKKYFPYRCTAGKLTIGIGRNLDDNWLTEEEQNFIFLDKKTKEEAIEYLTDIGLNDAEIDLLFFNDIEKVERGLQKSYSWYFDKPENVKLVMLDMAFNLGLKGFGTFYNTIDFIKSGDYYLASINMLKSKWAGQVGKRAQYLSKLIQNG